MKVFNLRLIGRWGNTLYQYMFAKAFCLKHNYELRCGDWVGSLVFQIQVLPLVERFSPVYTEHDLLGMEDDLPDFIEFESYCQSQAAINYTRREVNALLQFRPELLEQVRPHMPPLQTVCHRRLGDYFGYGYVVVSEKSYMKAMDKYGYDSRDCRFISEENGIRVKSLPDVLQWFPDFLAMCEAPVLFRANSSFSYWAALFGKPRSIYSPVIDGLMGGQEQDCEFVPGNHPRLANLHFVEELRVPDQ